MCAAPVSLTVFTFLNPIPILWGFLISIRQSADVSLPFRRFIEPTCTYHYRSESSAAFCASCRRHHLHVGADRHAGGYGLARTKTRHSRSPLVGLLAIRMLPQILRAIRFLVMARLLDISTRTAR